MDGEQSKATILGSTALDRGGTLDRVRCACGAVRLIARWAWAGNGCYRCKGCGAKVGYLDLSVTPRETKR